ncbi:MAG: hypothetical protein H9893_09000 [Candidatus Niameybacter stercoravium]|nr:hypothetical protein [Candidatus Niameybacter stercoravium]
MNLMQACFLINLSILRTTGLYTRGALTKGKYYHSDNIAFGPGIIEAYRIQEKQAKYVRMAVSDNVVNTIAETLVKYHYIKQSRDGIWYFNWYMLELEDAAISNTNEYDFEKVKQIAIKNKDTILKLLEKYKQSVVYEKYLWLINPFNDFCKSAKYFIKDPMLEEYIITIDNF